MLEIYLKSSVPVLDNPDNPTQILGWDIVYTGQRMDTLAEYSKTGTILLNTPIPYSTAITRDMLNTIVTNYADANGWDQEIINTLANGN